jgi:hypothetical protein
MKKIILFNALFYLSVLYGQSWTNYQLVAANTAANAPGLSQEEKNVFLYLNLARLYPSDFARIELKNHFGDRYNSGSLNWYESGLKSRLLSMSPLRAITFNSEMYQLAKCFSNEKARLGTTGHNRVNCTSGYSGECCSYGYSSGRRIILQLLIDDGVSSLGHREICLSTNYNSLGASINTHKSNSNCCVLDFTGRYGTDYSSSVVPSISSASPFTANSLSTNSYDPQVEISELRNKVNQLKSEVAEKEGIISNLNSEISTLKSNYYQLDAAKTNLNNNVYNLQQQQIQKDAQYNKLKDEFNMLSDRRTSVRRSKFNADEFHSFTFKIGLNTFYPSINPVSLGKFNSDYFSFGAETMIGFNFGDSYRRNSIGLTLRVNQTNRFLTKAIDSTSLQPKQYYDAEFTSIIREWLSIGIGGTIISDYGSNAYNVLPSGSIGLCFGPKNWKIQLTQQTAMDSNYKILGRASIGIALRL